MVGLKPSDVPPPLGVKVLSAGTAACIADLVTFPLDTAKVRLQIQGETAATGAAKGIRYRGVFGTISTMVRTEGPRSLYNGTLPNITRNALVNCTELVSYDLIKEAILKHKLMSGMKTHGRAHNQKPKQLSTAETFLWFSFRFVPSFLRLGSWNVVMFVSFEQLKRAMMMSRSRVEATT
ncbi:mitochondrial uncoupling protein 2-like [Sinocyclocheilus grahami]|uniref:mitochondrial uncoupling protein 2-like n=1 Tax=Sinocyclocheilus grahami TaxID=75366 RepID=UPI0007AD139F|nr:PREDICTED: mitochondrial uncoupling protein 2-like [Sinocyclocheilus grahami]